MPATPPLPRRAIATLKEGPLHAALKAWYREPGDEVEAPVGGLQIDLVRGDLLVEIQTTRFASLKSKLDRLLDEHRVRLVHPVAVTTWIVRLGEGGEVLGRRRSPRRGRLEDAFWELVSLRGLLAHPRLEVELLLVRQEEVRRHEPGRAFRRKGWVVVERRLVEVVERVALRDAADLARLLPPGLPSPFTTAELAGALGLSRDLAGKIAYCLREAGVLEVVGRRGNALRYRQRGSSMASG